MKNKKKNLGKKLKNIVATLPLLVLSFLPKNAADSFIPQSYYKREFSEIEKLALKIEPHKIRFLKDSDKLLLTRVLYGEARGELISSPDYVYGVIRSIMTRAKRKAKTIKKIILEEGINEQKGKTHHYTCFDPGDVNYEKIKYLSKLKDQEIWEKCCFIVEQALNGKLKGKKELDEVTNYFVGGDPEKYRTKKQAIKRRIPSWAYKMERGRFILDKNKKRIPRKPVAVVKTTIGNAYFYNFKYF